MQLKNTLALAYWETTTGAIITIVNSKAAVMMRMLGPVGDDAKEMDGGSVTVTAEYLICTEILE